MLDHAFIDRQALPRNEKRLAFLTHGVIEESHLPKTIISSIGNGVLGPLLTNDSRIFFPFSRVNFSREIILYRECLLGVGYFFPVDHGCLLGVWYFFFEITDV